MKVGLYDSVILTNGCEAAIVSILDDGKRYLADILKDDRWVASEEIHAEEIERALHAASDNWTPDPETERLIRSLEQLHGSRRASATVGQMNASYHTALEWDLAGRPGLDELLSE